MWNGGWIGNTTDSTPPILGGEIELYRKTLLFLKHSVRYLLFTGPFKENCAGNSLVVQWLKIQQPLVRELRSPMLQGMGSWVHCVHSPHLGSPRATTREPTCHNRRSCVLQLRPDTAK